MTSIPRSPISKHRCVVRVDVENQCAGGCNYGRFLLQSISANRLCSLDEEVYAVVFNNPIHNVIHRQTTVFGEELGDLAQKPLRGTSGTFLFKLPLLPCGPLPGRPLGRMMRRFSSRAFARSALSLSLVPVERLKRRPFTPTRTVQRPLFSCCRLPVPFSLAI